MVFNVALLIFLYLHESLLQQRYFPQTQPSIHLKQKGRISIEEQNEAFTYGNERRTNEELLALRKCEVQFRNPRMALCNYVNKAGNFGDEIGPAVTTRLLEDLLGCSAVNLKSLNLAIDNKIRKLERWTCLFTLGSIFHFVRSGDHVWGTGINPPRQRKYASNITLHAVRGELTQGLLRHQNLIDKRLPIGDPGFAVPTLFPEFMAMRTAAIKLNEGKPDRHCFVPHAHDATTANEELNKSIRIIPVFQHWEPVVESLATECDYVASSSLHGIIESDALGIPFLWIQWENSTTSRTEGEFKYQDYFSTVNRVVSRTSDISQVLNRSVYTKPLTEAISSTLVKKMKASFPFHLFETAPKEEAWNPVLFRL